MLIASIALALPLAGAALTGPAPWLPREAVLVSRDALTVDRAPLHVQHYRSRLSPEGVLAHWHQAHPVGPPERAIPGGWRIASHLQDATQETLQVRASARGGSEIVIARVNLEAALAPPLQPPLPLPAGAIVLRVIAFAETAGRASQFIVSLPGTPARALAQLCQRLRERGWQPAGQRGCEAQRADKAMWFLRGAETLGVDLRTDGARTRAVIGHVGPRP